MGNTFINAIKAVADSKGSFSGGVPITGIAAAAEDSLKEISDIASYFDTTNLDMFKNQLNSSINSMWAGRYNSVDDLLQTSRFANKNNATYLNERWGVGQVAGKMGQRVLEGASIGTSFAPGWGTLIGAAAGLVDGAIQSGIHNSQANKRLAGAWDTYNNFDEEASNAMRYGLNQVGRRKGLMDEFTTSMDLGGPLNHGTLWNDNVILVDNGGTHERNPFGGVPVGFDQEGTPNLVEEGEVIWNDYVFSNRLKMPKQLKNKYKLGGNKDNMLSFAAGVKASQAFKRLEEMPNDKIAKDTFNAFVSDLAMTQEDIRQRAEMKKQRQEVNKFKTGGFENGVYQGNWTWKSLTDALGQYVGSVNPSASSKARYKEDTKFDYGKYKNIRGLENRKGYNDFWDKLINDIKAGDEDALGYLRKLDEITGNEISPFFDPKTGELLKGEKSWDEELKRLARDNVMGANHLSADTKLFLTPVSFNEGNYTPIEAAPLNSIEDNIEIPLEELDLSEFNKAKKSTDGTIDAYGLAPLLMQLGQGIGTLVNRPDYSTIARYENYALSQPRAYTHPIGDYLRYEPFDINYAANRQAALQNNRARLLSDLSGSNKAVARANIVASDYGEQNDIGDLLLNAANANLQQRTAVGQFNKATNQYNSEDAYKTMAMNEDIYKSGLGALMQGAHDRMGIDTAYGNALSANLTTATQNAYDWAKYQKALQMIQDNPWFTDDAKRTVYAGKNGGLLTVKKIRRK